METKNLICRISRMDELANDISSVENRIVDNDNAIKMYIKMDCSFSLLHKWQRRNILLVHRKTQLIEKIKKESELIKNLLC